jgi:hypothetical protein
MHLLDWASKGLSCMAGELIVELRLIVETNRGLSLTLDRFTDFDLELIFVGVHPIFIIR